MGKFFILTGVANKAGIILDDLAGEGSDVGDEGVGDAGTTEEGFSNFAT